jgi:dTDP-4-dehydrorhamnose reductase
MKTILVTGSNGQLGNELKDLVNTYPQYQFLFTDYQELDITDENAVTHMVSKQPLYAIINCAAYTAVDKAETDTDNAYLINEIGAKNLAQAAVTVGAKFMHISTDFIFDGTHHSPILEDDVAKPISVYGTSKYAGEVAVMSANPDTVILRTSWVYSTYGSNFVKTIIRLCKERDQLNIIFDQIGTPTYAHDLARALLDVLDISVNQNISGVFHYSNEGVASWYDFAVAIRDLSGLHTPIYPIETSQYPTPAARPKYSILNKQKFKSTFGIEIPYWRDSLRDCIHSLPPA